MQRKNHLLKPFRAGMAMIMALTVIVIIATTLALALRLSVKTVKNTTDIYIYEQANLLVRSAGEYAKLKIALENNSTNCYHGEDTPFTENNIYDITLDVTYTFNTNTSADYNCTSFTYTSDLQQTENYGAARIDITVEVNDTTIVTEPIRIFKRKLIEL